MEEDEEALFAQAVAGSKPIKKQALYLKKQKTTVDFFARQQAATLAPEVDSNHLSDGFVERVEADGQLAYKAAGVQDGVFKKLRQGKYGIESRLDLHRQTVAQAREQVYQFIQDCVSNDIRVAIIVHGRGDRSPDNQAILKSYLNAWLRDMDEVLAFHSAQRHHAGGGAVYVLFRKSLHSRWKGD